MICRKFLILTVFFLTLARPAIAADPWAYLSVMNDVPLMAGLSEMTDSAFTFDKPSGRISEAVVQGKTDAATVEAFYRDTLPQLGWSLKAPGVWTREGEKMTLAVQNQDGVSYARFTLSPLHE